MIGPIRNHPIVLLKNFVSLAIVCAVMAFSMINGINEAKNEFGTAGLTIAGLVIIGIILAIFLILVRIWMKTTYTFNDTEIVSNKDTVFKKKKTIPYSKMASINVVRTIMDRIAGTSTLQFNVNSGVNAAVPEATLVVKCDISDNIYNFVHAKIMGETIPTFEDGTEVEQPESLVSYTPFEIVFHGLFSMQTFALLCSGIFFAYSIYGLFVAPNASVGTLFSLIMFATGLVVPVVSKIIRYYGFSVYRRGDTIYLDHGMLRKYHSEFDVARINSVKIVKPLIPRLFGKCYLQADVVGINAVNGDVTPTVCLLSSDRIINYVLKGMLPEFIYEGETMKQPSEARVPIYIGSIACLILTAIVSANILLLVNGVYNPSFVVESGILTLTNVLTIVCTVLLMVLFVFRGCISIRVKELTIGTDKFTIINGVVDRCVSMIQYDRVQAVYMKSGPIARRYSMAKCKVSLLSSAGGSKIGSGYFRIDDLERIHATMLRRIHDGSYDFKSAEM